MGEDAMEINEAVRIIKAVADGVNPFTGEVFPEGSIYQNPQTVRALHRAVGALEAQKKREERKTQLPENTGKPWSEEEHEQLMAAFDSGMGIKEIARKHKRTTGAIAARLENFGKIAPRTDQGR
jgi:hypothetical protein